MPDMADEDDTDWLTVRDVAEIYRVSEDTVYRAIRENRLVAATLGKKTLRIHRDDMIAWANK